MDNSTMNQLRDELLQSDTTFRQLASEHKKHEMRLDELASIHYPTDEEQSEETLLKKKKLALKDKMYAMLSRQDHAEAVRH